MKKYKLGEIAEIFNGSTPSTKNKDNYGGDIIWATPKDLSDQNSKYFYQGARNITQNGLKDCGAKMIPPNNILMSSRAPIGLLAINKVECCTNQGFKNIVLNKSLADENYLYYYLKLHINQIQALGSGTTFKEVSKIALERYEITIPELKDQQKIGRILSSIDDKIAINNQINAILERVARAIYEYYFVQFDFPNKQGQPYKSSGGAMRFDSTLNRPIPKDFEVQNLNTNSLTNIIPPNIEIFKGEKIYLPTANIQNDKIADFSNKITYKNRESRANMQPIANSVWFAKMKKSKKVLYFADYSQEWLDNLILSTGFCGLHCKNNSLEYIWNTINSTHFENQKDRLAHGATQQAVNNDDLLSIPLLIPTSEAIENFHNQVKFFYKQKYINELENQKLKNLRDFLLPLLINAQVQI